MTLHVSYTHINICVYLDKLGVNLNNSTADSSMVITFEQEIKCDWFMWLEFQLQYTVVDS